MAKGRRQGWIGAGANRHDRAAVEIRPQCERGCQQVEGIEARTPYVALPVIEPATGPVGDPSVRATPGAHPFHDCRTDLHVTRCVVGQQKQRDAHANDRGCCIRVQGGVEVAEHRAVTEEHGTFRPLGRVEEMAGSPTHDGNYALDSPRQVRAARQGGYDVGQRAERHDRQVSALQGSAQRRDAGRSAVPADANGSEAPE